MRRRWRQRYTLFACHYHNKNESRFIEFSWSSFHHLNFTVIFRLVFFFCFSFSIFILFSIIKREKEKFLVWNRMFAADNTTQKNNNEIYNTEHCSRALYRNDYGRFWDENKINLEEIKTRQKKSGATQQHQFYLICRCGIGDLIAEKPSLILI